MKLDTVGIYETRRPGIRVISSRGNTGQDVAVLRGSRV